MVTPLPWLYGQRQGFRINRRNERFFFKFCVGADAHCAIYQLKSIYRGNKAQEGGHNLRGSRGKELSPLSRCA